MRRALFVFVLTASLAPAQSIHTRMGELSRKLPGALQRHRPPGAAERLGAGMDSVRTTLRQLEQDDAADVPGTVREERRKLALLDEAWQSELARIESTLRNAGLTTAELDEKLAIWHGFTAHYRRRMDASLAAFDRVSRSGASRREIAALRAGLGEPAVLPGKRVPAAPSTLSPPHFSIQAEAISQPAAADQPTPDDLAQTSIVKLSPDIRVLAAALGNSPAALYAYVYNNIRWVPYILAMQNSEAVLWSRRGNDADQSTLLIALLRAAGIPARYVTAFIDIPIADVINWVGAKDETVARQLLTASSVVIDHGDHVQIMHTWVEAWVDNGQGPAWIAMSPGLKKQTFQSGLPLPIPVFDRMQYLSVPTTRLATDVYADQIHAALARSFPGHEFGELGYTGTIVPADANTLPQFPYPYDTVLTRAAALPDIAKWKATVTLYDAASNKVYLSSSFFLPEISQQSLTISYVPATPADQRAITSFGGIDKTPAGMANLLAQFRLDDTVVATSTVPIPTLQPFGLTDAIYTPHFSEPRTGIYGGAAGEPGAIALVGAQISDTWIGSRIDGLLAKISNNAPLDSIVRETLFLAGLLHNQRFQEASESVSGPLQYVSDYSLLNPFGTHLLSSPAITPLFDRPFLATARWFAMDDGIKPLHPISLKTSLGAASHVNVYQAIDAARSQSECQTFEQLALITSVCTISVMQTASQNNIRILTINQANAATTLPAIVSLPADMLSTIRSYIQSGATVTITQKPVTVGTWTGFPWIVDWADISFGSFFGINQINGGYTGGDPNDTPAKRNPGVTGNPTSLNGTTCSDPVTISNGNMFQQETDLAISSRGPAFALTRTYNSLAAANNGPFGYGWTHSYATYLKDNGSSMTLVDGSGGVYTFAFQGSAYLSPAGLNLKLTRDAQGYIIRAKHGTQLRFDTKGALQSITDRNQNAMTLSYDTSGRLTSVTDALSRAVTLSYDTASHIVSVQEFTGRRITYTYDSTGNLAAVTDAGGNRTAYAYYTGVFAHLLQTATKPNGNWTSFEYYVNRQTARVSDTAGRNTRFLYLPFSNQSIFIDARGFSSSYYYNALGNVTRVVKPDGNYVDSVYTADAKLAARTDESGRTWKFTYDALGNPTTAVDPQGATVQLTYEPLFNQLASITDPRGAVTKYEYDANGNRTHVVAPLGVEARFTYDTFGELLTATDAEGNTTSITYDASGNPMRIADPLGNATQLRFDALRRVTGITDALGNAHGAEYDALDRLTRIVDPLENSAAVAYDSNGNPSQTTDPNGRVTHYAYDALDNFSGVTDAQGNSTQYGYTTIGCGCSSGSDLTSFHDAAGVTQALAYDFDHRLTQIADSAGNLTGFAYNARGNLVKRTDANSNTIQFEYDAIGRLVRRVLPDGAEVRFTYDINGNLTGATNANTSLAFTYDDRNRMTSAADSRFGKTIRYTYNRNGLRTALADSEGGVTAYTYDANSRLMSLTAPSGAAARFTYDALSRPSAIAFSNGVTATYQYDAASELTALVYSGAGNSSRLPQFAYTYDKNGNTTSIADASGAHSYRFDELNRLTAASHPALPAETYTYDGAGNRMASATDSNYAYDRAGRLLSAEGVSYTYDRNGNLVARSDANGVTTYTYNFEDQLTGIRFPDGTAAAYKYDALGRRIEKNINGNVTTYLYDGFHILLEMDAAGAMQARYTHGPGVDRPLTMERGGQAYFYLGDLAGSVAALTDSSGATVCAYTYDSFGRTQPCQTVANPFGFAGREYDVESALYYMRARYYDPAIGRFLSTDPLQTALLVSNSSATQRLNTYSYALNNPLAFRDPMGLTGCSSQPAFRDPTGLNADGPDDTSNAPEYVWITWQRPVPVGKVVEATKMVLVRGGIESPVRLGQDVFIDDMFTTDPQTIGMLELATGGRVGINKNTTIFVTSETSVEEIGRGDLGRARLAIRRIWARIGTRNEELIETHDGMSIKG